MAKLLKKSYASARGILELPKLIDVQLNSFEQFKEESLSELFEEISPIESFNGDLKLYFPCDRPEVEGFDLKFWFGEPVRRRRVCRAGHELCSTHLCESAALSG